MNKKLLIGLGNPGPKYENTRHNFGERVVRVWVEGMGSDSLREQRVDYLLPSEFMNESGRAVAAHLKNHPVAFESILIVHDDMELPLGEVKLVPGGSAKGHNGVKSIQEALGTLDVPRLRLGVGRPPEGVEPRDFVLERFTQAEEKLVVEKAIPQAANAIETFVKQ